MEFEKQQLNTKLSLIDIINTFFASKKHSTKFYFKVLDIEDEEEGSENDWGEFITEKPKSSEQQPKKID